MKLKQKQEGFHVIELAIVLAVIGVIGFVGFKVLGSEDKKANNSSQPAHTIEREKAGPPIWEYNLQEHKWFVASGEAPKCPDPLMSMTPVDMSKVTAVLLPGAYRGFSYKAHGAFRVAQSTKGEIEVKMPMDGNLRGITRYYEAPGPGRPHELQYLVDFENDCGIAFRFDHLHTLTAEFQAVAEKSPPPKKDDTRRDPPAERISIPFKAGTVVATGVGYRETPNYGFDFGMYDYRSRNEISKNPTWANMPVHEPYAYQHYHGICWIQLLPGGDAAKAEAMAKDRNNYNLSKPFNLTSDYCTFAPYKTLDINNGEPTDG